MTSSHGNGPVLGAPAIAPPDYDGPPAPPAPAAGPTVDGVGLLARLRLTEPVRLYLYSIAVLIVAGLTLAGVLTGDWQAYAISAAATVLGVAGGTEAARASVYSPRGVAGTARMVAAGARAGTIGKALDL